MKPKIIKTEAEHTEALACAERLRDAKASTAKEEELELWTLLAECYEQEHFPHLLTSTANVLKRLEITALDPMIETTENDSPTPCISELRDRTFFVPFYQRGYRWQGTQVKQLLDDINENTKETQKYSLKPIVVAQNETTEGKLQWELIDGQQRLTTLNLILLALEEKQIQIQYERHLNVASEPSRKLGLEINKHLRNEITSSKDWDTIKLNESHLDTVDNHHIVEAWLAIKSWLGEPPIKSAILERTTVIWHEVGSENGTSEFLRFNTGKIHLSPCELLKARFLAPYKPPMIHRSPTEIAAEWDQMESAFHEAEFWSYLHPSQNVTEAPNRIALLFELLAPSKKDDHGGKCYLDKFPKASQVSTIEELWLELRRCFLTLQEWFADRDIRHKVGFLRWSRTGKGVDLFNLWTNFQQGRAAFNSWLSVQVKGILAPAKDPNKWQVAKFEEPKDRHYLQDVLLWFNIDTLPPGADYPFARHASVDTWSLEHIHAQSSPEEANIKQLEEWKSGCMTLLNHLKKNQAEPGSKIDDLLTQMSELTLKEGTDSEILKQLDGDLNAMLPPQLGEDLGKVWNLALLGGRENSALFNAFFHQKRSKILEFEQCPENFVPPATVRAFLKGYTSEPEDLMLWDPRDREAYKKRFGEVLDFTTNKGLLNHG